MRAVIYARLSVSNEQSVSISRQLESCRQYAEARGWEIVGEFTDDGVSASKNRPEDRDGWNEVVNTPGKVDRVIIWKLDRLARRVLDFHLANETLEARGAALVAVENSIDMGSPDGRLIANVLASFAEYEAEAIRARVKAARTHLVKAGRAVGRPPYGWQNVPNPSGAGKIVVKHPEEIKIVEQIIERTLAGHSIYNTMCWLNSEGIPTPTGRPEWKYNPVERIIRHPYVAGLVPLNDASVRHDYTGKPIIGKDGRPVISKNRGNDYLRDDDGLPIVHQHLAIMPLPKWRAMLAKLDEPQTGKHTPRTLTGKSSAVLSGLVLCGEHDEPLRMVRKRTKVAPGREEARDGFVCTECHQSITNFEHLVIEDFLAAADGQARWTRAYEVHDDPASMLPEIEHRIAELGGLITKTKGDERAKLLTQLDALQELQAEARSKPGLTQVTQEPVGLFAEDWAAAHTDTEKNAVLLDAFESITVRRGGTGRQTDERRRARLTYKWQPMLGEVTARLEAGQQ